MPNGTEGFLLVAAAVAYLIASVGYGANLLLRRLNLARTGQYAAILAVVCHTFAIGVHCAVTRQTPFTTPAETLSASAWTVALVYLILEFLIKPKPYALGALALPASFLCLFAGAVLHQTQRSNAPITVAPELDSRLISLHVIAILFAFSLLMLAFGCALLYLVQHRMLKRKRSGGLFGKLPPLTTLETQAFSMVAFAFPLLTVGLVSGVIRAAAGGLSGAWAADPKILASTVTWLVYGVYLGLHSIAHWRGPRANYILIGGLLAALATYFMPTTAHRFG
ncbi:MAG: cytochrome c biogenesis protein CcsA [Capsulimonas sp.]|uniref:cytochrome C assembly family protein n=1 Tax=Capsulimonas sp. TaxID=2494211 RepID=UPI003266568A